MRLSFLTDFNETEAYLAVFKAAELTRINQNRLLYRLINPTYSEIVLPNGIIVYGNEEVVKALSEVINCHDI